jgi:hypothetical protein
METAGWTDSFEETEKEEKRVEATTTTWSERHCVRETTEYNTP